MTEHAQLADGTALRRARRRALALALLGTVTACAGATPAGPRPSTPPATRSGTATPAATTTATDPTARRLARLSLAQRVGQLVMVGGLATGPGRSTETALSRYQVGNVMLTGRSRAGTRATARVAARLRAQVDAAGAAGVRLLVATDQEGGVVQVLTGPGFSTIPDALTQGNWGAAALRRRATGWGRQLTSAGINLNLAPVTDVVPSTGASGNAPIGASDRQFGSDPGKVAAHATAFSRGLGDAGVLATAKHFPGLGRVRGNTDTSAAVTDDVTTPTGASVRAFGAVIDDGVPVVMTSSATYSRIDPAHPACFSRIVISGLLRQTLGFDGVVISDDLSNARQVARWSPGSRAVQFIAAGGDIVLTVNPDVAPAMVRALIARARRDGAFRRRVDAAALRVLRLKDTAGAGLPVGAKYAPQNGT